MKIAIIGTGLAGLAAGLFLSRLGSHVTFFDKRGIGQGASGVAAGLIHPYVGEQTRPSLWAKDAVLESKALFLQISPKSILEEGIVRLAQNDEQKKALLSYSDVECIDDDHFLIKSGLVIDTKSYLQALYDASKGELVLENIEDLHSLDNFDRILVATGYEAEKLLPECKTLVNKKKGQLLDVLLEKPMPSMIAKGYLAKGIDRYHWGSTYESTYENESPDAKRAQELLETNQFPFVSPPKIVGCRAGIRLTRKGHYVPIATKVGKKIWWFGALGSRGLLYHAYLGRKVAEAMLCDDLSVIPKECRCNQNFSF
jgi:glycine/D-amino acid oxidase-like deaminating enzyme